MRGSAFVARCFGEFVSTYHRIGMSQVGVHVPLFAIGWVEYPAQNTITSIHIYTGHSSCE